MKKLLLSSAICCMSLMMYAQKAEKAADPHAGHNHAAPAAAPANEAKPVVSAVAAEKMEAQKSALVVKEEVYDFGKIPQGKPVTHVFEVFNESAQPLKITNVQASCGCTTPVWDKEGNIPAGGSTKITVGYNAQAEGNFMKPITITYGEGNTKVINIKGEVWKTPAASAPENKGLSEIKN